MRGGIWSDSALGKSSGRSECELCEDLASSACPARLACGAQVRVMEFDSVAGRMSYELVQGSGPASGWAGTFADFDVYTVHAIHDREESGVRLHVCFPMAKAHVSVRLR